MSKKTEQELADELIGSIFKDKELRLKSNAIQKDLARKIIKNQYHPGPAREQWIRLIAQMGKPGHFHPYSPEVRSIAADQMAEFFEDEVKNNSVSFLYEVAGVKMPL